MTSEAKNKPVAARKASMDETYSTALVVTISCLQFQLCIVLKTIGCD